MEKAFNIYRESDEKEMAEWLVGNGLEREAVGKIIAELKRNNMDLIDVLVDSEDEEVTVVDSDSTGIEFNFSGDAVGYGKL